MTAVDRRVFLARTAAIAAAAATGAATLPSAAAAWSGGPAHFGPGAYVRPRPEALADPTELTLAEAAMLAALPKAPSHYDPRRHPEAALARRNLVLDLMLEQGRIPRLMAEDARRSELEIAPAPRQAQVESGLAPYFVERVRRELEERFGANLYTQPLRIVTTLDSAAQRAAEEEMRRQLKTVEDGELGLFEGARYSLVSESPRDGTPYLQGAFVMLDARTGDVLAWVGGRDYAHSQFDRVEQARRQPGSAFKPFVYAAALARGWVLSQPLVDRPLQVKMPNGQVWKPRNFTGRYEGRVSMRDALVRSKNVATVRLAGSVGLGRVVDLAKEAGIEEPISAVPSLALGTITVSPLELTSAYTAFATLGQAAEPRLLLRVENEDGKVLWRSGLKRHEVLQPAVAYLVTDVLSEALVRGTGSLVQQTGLKVPAAGKTGTTNQGTDAWFVGYTPEIAAGVWIGFDQNRPILTGATGGQLAAPVWGRVMARVYEKRRHPRPWRRPVEVVSRPVDPSTGLVIEERCAKSDSPRELFVEGLVPASFCPGRENPPRNGFPAQQQMIAERLEREAQEEKLAAQRREAEEETRIARVAEAEERELRQEEIALIAEARRREQLEAKEQQTQAQAREEREAQRPAQAETKEQEEAKKREQARREELAERKAREDEKRKAEEEKRAQFQQRRERLAKAKADADRREREIAAREKALQDRDRPAKKADEEDRTARVLAEERRAREREEEEQEEEARRAREREAERMAREEEDEEDTAREERSARSDDLSGWWEMTNTIQSTNYAQYKGLRLGYRLQLEQDGDRISGRGQKWSENGRTLPSSARTPITVTGTVDGDTVNLRFTERGAKRTTGGSFSWELSADRTALKGSFESTAAKTSGRSVAYRMP